MTFKYRQIIDATRGLAVVALAAGLLLLTACGGSKVQKLGPDTQGGLFPPGVLPDAGLWGPGTYGPRRPATPSTPYVALLLPLSGKHARIGKSMLNAAQLAVFEIAGNEFVLIVRDTGGTAAGARAAARSALRAGASLILGPLFAHSVQAVAEQARPSGVNVISFSNDVSVAGGGVYVMGLAPRSQVKRVLDYASLQGLRRYGIIAPDNTYGHTVIQSMQTEVEENNDELTQIAFYNTAEDPSPQVQILADYDERHEALLERRKELEAIKSDAAEQELERLKFVETIGRPDFDAVMLPVGGKNLLTLAPLLAFYDVDPAEVQFLGTAFWADARLGSEVTLQGGWFAAPPPAMWDEFKKRYQATYGKEPVRIASLTYDATALAAVLSRNATSTGRPPDFTTLAITQPSGFAGMDGIFRFLPSGEIQRGLAVLKMTKEGLEVLDPAPQSFDQLIN